MSVVHRVTGYNKRTEKLEVEFDIPENRLDEVRDLVKAPASQSETFGSFPIEAHLARQVARNLRLPMKIDRYDWFLEPFAEP